MSQNPFVSVNHERHTLRRHVLRIRNLERRPGGAGSRRVYGQVDGSNGDHGYGAGVLDPGSEDWTIATDGSGTWTIAIDPPFIAPFAVGLAANETTSDPPVGLAILSRALDTLVIGTYEHSDDLLSDDIGFDFQLIGV